MTDAGIKPTAILTWDADPDAERGIMVRFRDYPSQYNLSLGDGTVKLIRRPNQLTLHTYEKPGAYTVQARKPGDGQLLAGVLVVVQDGLTAPLTLRQTDDETEYFWVFASAPDDKSRIACCYDIDWGEGDAPERHWIPPGGQIRKALRDGDHDVQVRNLHTQRTATIPFEVQTPYDPDFTTAYNPDDATGMSALLTITKLGTVKPLTLDLGDGTTQDITSPAKDQVIKLGPYAQEKSYLVTLSYKDGTGKAYTDMVTVPWK